MVYQGRRRFHEGSYLADFVLGDAFVNRTELHLYACVACGKVELFANEPAA